MLDFDDEPVENWEPGPEITKALFKKWRNARRGTSHAEKMNNPVWQWLIQTRISAYQANQHFHGPTFPAAAGWCCNRFGQSKTSLPDGRTILIAGEHEDYYDTDFYIYNDVIVFHPDKSVDIYGYPEADFPPTDFHSATLVDDQIILIGTLGYSKDRKPGTTQVMTLDTDTLKVERRITTGQNPGWIFKHSALILDDNRAIEIHGGKCVDTETTLENIDDWKLDLNTWHWERLTDRQWPRIEFFREDGELNQLSRIRQVQWKQEMSGKIAVFKEGLDEEIKELKSAIGATPDFALARNLYRPAVDHEVLPQAEDEYNVFRVKVGGVVIRYVEDSSTVWLTVEGNLPTTTIDNLVSELRMKLGRLENTAYESRRF